MTFCPQFTVTLRIVRQIVAIERTTGFLSAVRLKPDWLSELRQRTQVRDAMASIQIEGHSVTFERAFELANDPEALGGDSLRQSEREFLNYLRTFDAVEALQNDRDAVLTMGDLRNLHQNIVSGVRGSRRMSCEDGMMVESERGRIDPHRRAHILVPSPRRLLHILPDASPKPPSHRALAATCITRCKNRPF